MTPTPSSTRPEHDATRRDLRPSPANAELRGTNAIAAIAEPVAAAHQCEIVNLEFRREPHGFVLRLYIERLGHDPRSAVGGVTLATCAKVSRDLGLALDVAEAIDHAYHLEVSSPGLHRPLTKLADFSRFAGMRARVQLREPVEAFPGRKVFRGVLEPSPRSLPITSGGETGRGGESVDRGEPDATIGLREDDLGAVALPLATIAKANLIFELESKQPPKHLKKHPQSAREHTPETHAPDNKSHHRGTQAR